MENMQKDFCRKALLMIALAGAILGVARAGYDEGSLLEEDSHAVTESDATRQMHAQMLIRTLSEEFTEVQDLASQQARFRQMGDAESTQIARMYGRWIREHKAGVPALARLIRLHGANPEEAKELKNPTLGSKDEMLMATHSAHVAAVNSSQMRYAATGEWGIQWFMHNRANLARKHLAEMAKYHDM
jgi:hypothetical protein